MTNTDISQQIFIVLLRDLENKRDLKLLELQNIINYTGVSIDLDKAEEFTFEAMKYQQAIDFLKDNFTQQDES